MEIFILQSGKSEDVSELKDILEEIQTLTPEFTSRTKKRYSLALWLHLAVALHNVNQHVVLPLTLWMMLQEYRGLSRLGRVLCNYVGLAPSLRTYDTIKADLLRSATHQIATITSSGRCIISIDNYTHQYGSSALTTGRRTQYHLPMYTVGAVIEWPSDVNVNIERRLLPNGQWLASLPESINDLKPFVSDVSSLPYITPAYIYLFRL
jgi:hypothetical protein